MANNCLVTKLKGTVDNSDLLKVGEMRINCSTARCGGTTTQNMRRFYLSAYYGTQEVTVTAEGRTFLYNNQPYTTYTGVAGGTDVAFEFPDGEYNISITPKYNIDSLNDIGGSIPTQPSKFFMIDVGSFDYSTPLGLQLYKFYTFGDFRGDLSNVVYFWPTWGDGCLESHNTVDLSCFNGNEKLAQFKCDSSMTRIYGSINNIKSPNITSMVMVDPNVTGSFDQLLDDMVAAGKTTGAAYFHITGGGITYKGDAITEEWVVAQGAPYGWKDIKVEFDPSYTDGYRLVFDY